MQSGFDPTFMESGGDWLIVLWLVFFAVWGIFTIFMAFMWWKIMARTGWPGWPGGLGLLMLFPPAMLVLMAVMAFSEWPVQRELRLARQQLAGGAISRPGP